MSIRNIMAIVATIGLVGSLSALNMQKASASTKTDSSFLKSLSGSGYVCNVLNCDGTNGCISYGFPFVFQYWREYHKMLRCGPGAGDDDRCQGGLNPRPEKFCWIDYFYSGFDCPTGYRTIPGQGSNAITSCADAP